MDVYVAMSDMHQIIAAAPTVSLAVEQVRNLRPDMANVSQFGAGALMTNLGGESVTITKVEMYNGPRKRS